MATTADESLKQQFEQLQAQQQQRLQKRREAKLRKNQPDAGGQHHHHDNFANISNGTRDLELTAENTASSFGIDDQLDLKVQEPVPRSVSYMSEELVDHLNEQIRELKDENGRLFKLLSERDFQIRQLKKKREEDRLALVGSSQLSSDTAATKIVELSKKVRELSAAIEAKKTETQQLFGRCRHLENELANKEDKLTSSPRRGTVTAVDGTSPRSRISDADAKVLGDRLRAADLRNAEYRNQVQALKLELKMAHKVIANEVGEGFIVQELLNGSNNWRGRAQQVLALQKKVSELKVQLEQQTPRSNRTNQGDDLEAEFMGTQLKNADMKHRETIRKLEKERKESLERSAQELRALEADYTTLKQKLDASKARNKVLANENKAFKSEMQKFIDKGQHDDELISALIAQQNNMKQMLEDLTNLQRQNQETQEERMSAMAARKQQENNLIQQLKDIICEKESKVKILENELIAMRNMQRVEESQRQSVNALIDRAASQSSGWVEDETLQNESEIIQSPSPPPAVSRHGSRSATTGRASTARLHTSGKRPQTSAACLQSSVSEPTNCKNRPSSASRVSSRAGTPADQNNRANTSKGSRPNTSRSQEGRELSAHERKQLAEVENQVQEYQIQVQENQSLAQAAQVERDKLMELVQLMQTRLDEAYEQSQLYQNEMKQHKQNAVLLEKRLGKMRLESAASSKTSAAGGRKREKTTLSMGGSLTDVRSLNGNTENRLDELETTLAIQKDENSALKAALESTLKAKEEDLKLYNEMIEQTKMVFLQGLRQFKNSISS